LLVAVIDASTTAADLAQAILTAADRLRAKIDYAHVTKAGLGAVGLTDDHAHIPEILAAADSAFANLTHVAQNALDLSGAALITGNLTEADLAIRDLKAAVQTGDIAPLTVALKKASRIAANLTTAISH
jgi:uncharacterized protein YjbI with pentapeptide repeats